MPNASSVSGTKALPGHSAALIKTVVKASVGEKIGRLFPERMIESDLGFKLGIDLL